MSLSLTIVAALFLLRFVQREASYRRAKQDHGFLRFPVGIGLRGTLRVGGPFAVFIAARMAEEATNGFAWAVIIIIALSGLALVALEPGEIRMTPSGLTQTSWIGLSRRTIPWIGAGATYTAATREVLVVGSDGTQITHTPYHVGQSQLLFELLRNNVPIIGDKP